MGAVDPARVGRPLAQARSAQRAARPALCARAGFLLSPRRRRVVSVSTKRPRPRAKEITRPVGGLAWE